MSTIMLMIIPALLALSQHRRVTQNVYSRRLYCILGERVPVPVRKGTASVLRSGGDDAKLLVVGAALAGGDGTSLVLMMGH